MDQPTARRPLLLSALILAALAASSRAADNAGGPLPPSSPIEDLRSGAARPEAFERFIEGSVAKHGSPEHPGIFAPRDERVPDARVRLSRPQAGLRPGGITIPPAPSANARKPSRSLSLGIAGLSARRLAAVLGLGFFLIAASMLETPSEPAAQPEPRPDILAAPPPSVRAPTPPPAPARVASAPFIDTRMPVPTWRAISRREQELIERWDASREKSLGLASFPEWLDAGGLVEGVDIPLLKAKLRRDA